MKIVWSVNARLPQVDRLLGKEQSAFGGGWLVGLSENLLRTPDVELCVCYPNSDNSTLEQGKEGVFSFYGLPIDIKTAMQAELDHAKLKEMYKEILEKEKPDIIHIFGTEFSFSYVLGEVAKECGLLDRTIVSIQGMVGYYAKHYFDGLPFSVIHSMTLSEAKNKFSIKAGHDQYVKRAKYEKMLLETVHNVIGRTEWDRGCTYLINPRLNYYFCNETLRKPFYSGNWDYEACEKHSILISQAGYPIKGFHMLLEALPYVRRVFKDVKVYVAGANITGGNRIKGNTYGLYIESLIKKYHLQDHVVFTGPLNAEEMKAHMLKVNAFVCPSSIENSPNSLGEAMLLGVPCVSADVGGVRNMMTHEQEGYIYPFNETYMLAYYLIRLFKQGKKAEEMGQRAKVHAMVTHNEQTNNDTLLEIYQELRKNHEK